MAAALLGAAAPAFAAVETTAYTSRLDDLNERGRNVITVTSSRPGAPTRISRSSCDALAKDPDVRRAGMLVPAPPVTAPQLESDVPVMLASTSLFPELGSTDVLIGPLLARAGAGVGPARRRLLLGDVLATARVAALQPEGIRVNSSLISALPARHREGDACFVVTEPLADPDTVAERIAAQLDTRDGAVSARPVLRETTSTTVAFRERPSRFLPLGLAVVGAALTGFIARSRTRETASYRLSGTSRTETLLLTTFEQVSIAGVGLLSGLVTVNVLHTPLLAPAVAMAFAMAQFAAWVPLGVAASIPTTQTNPGALARQH